MRGPVRSWRARERYHRRRTFLDVSGRRLPLAQMAHQTVSSTQGPTALEIPPAQKPPAPTVHRHNAVTVGRTLLAKLRGHNSAWQSAELPCRPAYKYIGAAESPRHAPGIGGRCKSPIAAAGASILWASASLGRLGRSGPPTFLRWPDWRCRVGNKPREALRPIAGSTLLNAAGRFFVFRGRHKWVPLGDRSGGTAMNFAFRAAR